MEEKLISIIIMKFISIQLNDSHLKRLTFQVLKLSMLYKLLIHVHRLI